ncbi:MAG TPA: hypothetical protein VIY51_06850 [Xanthobacteraceae bacterium]
MQNRYVGNVGDFGKLALLRCLMEGRRLAVCWYLTSDTRESKSNGKSFDYLNRPEEFRHLAPDIFDALAKIVAETRAELRGVAELEGSGLLPDAVFHRSEVPRDLSLRQRWSEELVQAVNEADLVFLDPDNGIQGTRPGPKHVALAEIAALRRQGRTLVFAQRQTGRRSQVSLLARQLWSIGCQRIELVRFRLIASRLYVVTDHDEAKAGQIAEFARKWGKWVTTYRF